MGISDYPISGVASDPAVFQKTMNVVLQGMPKVICYLNDILVSGGSSEKEHLKNVEYCNASSSTIFRPREPSAPSWGSRWST